MNQMPLFLDQPLPPSTSGVVASEAANFIHSEPLTAISAELTTTAFLPTTETDLTVTAPQTLGTMTSPSEDLPIERWPSYEAKIAFAMAEVAERHQLNLALICQRCKSVLEVSTERNTLVLNCKCRESRLKKKR
jgi:hypothetical protein